MPEKARKNAGQVTGRDSQSGKTATSTPRHVTEISVREGIARVSKGWRQLRTMLVIPDYDREDDAPYSTTTGALFDFIGQELVRRVGAGVSSAVVTRRAANEFIARAARGQSITINHFSKELSRWRVAESAAKGAATPAEMLEGDWLVIRRGLSYNEPGAVLFRIVPPRKVRKETGEEETTRVEVRFRDDADNELVLPANDRGSVEDEEELSRPGFSGSDRNAELLDVGRKQMRLAVQTIARALPPSHPAHGRIRQLLKVVSELTVGALVLLFIACAVSPTLRKEVTRVLRAAGHFLAPKLIPHQQAPQPSERPEPPPHRSRSSGNDAHAELLRSPRDLLAMLADDRIPDTIHVSYADGKVTLWATPSFPRFGMRRTTTRWEKWAVVAPLLQRHDAPDMTHDGRTWIDADVGRWNRYVYVVTITSDAGPAIRQSDAIGVHVPVDMGDGQVVAPFGTFRVEDLLRADTGAIESH